MSNLFSTNEYGHNQAAWKYLVRGTISRRRWYARRIASSLGDRLSMRERAATALNGERGRLDIDADTGFRVLPPGTFGAVPELVNEARRIIDERDAALADGNKTFLKQGFLDDDRLRLCSPFMAFALDEELLAAITRYLGVVPILQNTDVWKSDNSHDKHSASQLYHCDWDDLTQVKLFIYCSDVDNKSGPLTLIEAAASERLGGEIGYTYRKKRYRVTDEEATSVVGESAQHSVTGSSGTVVLADTSRCFHYGSRVKEGGQSRYVAFAQFVSPTSFLFPRSGYVGRAPYAGLVDERCSKLQRMVLGAD